MGRIIKGCARPALLCASLRSPGHLQFIANRPQNFLGSSTLGLGLSLGCESQEPRGHGFSPTWLGCVSKPCTGRGEQEVCWLYLWNQWWVDGRMDGWMEGRKEGVGWMEGRMGGWMNVGPGPNFHLTYSEHAIGCCPKVCTELLLRTGSWLNSVLAPTWLKPLLRDSLMLSPSELGPSSDRPYGIQMWSPVLPSSLFSARPQLEPTHLKSLVLCRKGRLPDADRKGCVIQ